MRLILDGVTPAPRTVMIRGFLLRHDFHVGLDEAAFVPAGDRLSYEAGDLVVTRPDGRRRRHRAGGSHWICR